MGLDEPGSIDDRRVGRDRHRFGRARDVADRPGPEHARAEAGSMLVARPDRDEARGREAEGGGGVGGQRAGDVGRGRDDRKPAALDLRRCEEFCRPVPGPDVVEEGRRRVRVVDDSPAGQAGHRPAARQVERLRAGVGVGCVGSEPQDLRRDVARVEVQAGPLEQFLRRHPPAERRGLVLGPPIEPDDRRVEVRAASVDRDDPVDLAGERDRRDVAGCEVSGRDEVGDDLADRDPPVGRVLLGPRRGGNVEIVGPGGLPDQLTDRVEQQALEALRPEVDPDDMAHECSSVSFSRARQDGPPGPAGRPDRMWRLGPRVAGPGMARSAASR